MRLRRTSTLALAISLTCAPSAAALQDDSLTTPITAEQYGVILNLSGRQRMLTQKMSKELLLVAGGHDAATNAGELLKTTTLFKTTLKGLRDGDSATNLPATQNKRIVKQLDKVAKLYDELEPLFSSVISGKTPMADQVTLLASKNVPLLKEMNKAVKMYERESRSVLSADAALAVVINLAGKQRMLTQKMSKEFLLISLGIEKADNCMNVRETSSLFDRTLKGLLDGDTDLELPGTVDEKIRAQLGTVQALWKEFFPLVSKASNETAELTQADIQRISAGNIPLLKEMNKAVKMYEQLARD